LTNHANLEASKNLEIQNRRAEISQLSQDKASLDLALH